MDKSPGSSGAGGCCRACYAGIKTSCLLCWSIPLGSVVAIKLALIGTGMAAHGLREMNSVTEKYGGNIAQYIGILVTIFTVLTVVDFVAAFVGLREQLRLAKFSCCQEIISRRGAVGCCNCLISWVFYWAMQLSMWCTIVLALLMLLLFEAVWMLALAISESCKGSEDGVGDLVDMLNKVPINADINVVDDEIQDFCDDFSTVERGSLSTFIGSLLMLLAQITALAYWMKYQTLEQIKLDKKDGNPGSPELRVEAVDTASDVNMVDTASDVNMLNNRL